MRLLFDHNLSLRLVARLQDLFPNSAHVFDHALDRADDRSVWSFARQHGFTLVTKDSDFNDLATLEGPPPKVVWLRIGNCTTQQVETLLRSHHSAMLEFHTDAQAAVLELL